MRVLYIPSGYSQIYTSFDLCIERALQKLDIDVLKVPLDAVNFEEMIEDYQPDISFVMLGFKMPIEKITILRKKGVLLAVWLTEDPYFIDHSINIIHLYDYVFTIDIAALDVYKENGHKHVYHLPLGSDPMIFQSTEVEKQYTSDICLVGYPYPDRVKLINHLLEKTDYFVTVVGRQWEKMLHKPNAISNLNIVSRWVTPKEVNQYFNGAKINLNTHRPFHLKQNQNKRGILPLSINNRTFDIACSESFQLIDYKDDLYNNFNRDDIVHFENGSELITLTEYFYSNVKERLIFSKNANSTVLSRHTFYHRMLEMSSILKK